MNEAPSLKHAVVAGAAWTAISRVVLQAFSLVGSVTMARILDPGIFGLMGMAGILVGFVSLFRDIGLGPAIVRADDIDQRTLSNAFWANAALGLAAALACVATAPLASWFYRDARVEGILYALAPGFVLGSLFVVPGSLLVRRMRFRAIAIAECVAALASMVTGVGLAVRGDGVWALVWSGYVGSAFGGILTWRAAGWRPSPRPGLSGLRALWGFGANLTAFNIVNFFARNADNALLGRYSGAAVLGQYQIAYQLMLYPVQNIAGLLGRVLFPALSLLRNDPARLRRAYLDSVSVIGALSFPLMAGLACVSDLFVTCLLGDHWGPASHIIRILAPVGLVQSVLTTAGLLYQATGRTDLMLRWGTAASLLTVAGFAAGIPWGGIGVAAAYAVTTAILTWPGLAIPLRLVGLNVRDVARSLAPQAGATVAMVLAVLAVRHFLAGQPGLHPALALAACVATGGIVYGACLFAFPPPAFAILVADLATLVRRKSSAWARRHANPLASPEPNEAVSDR